MATGTTPSSRSICGRLFLYRCLGTVGEANRSTQNAECKGVIGARATHVIASILDNDLYKFTMQQAVLDLYADVSVTYEFIDRDPAGPFDRGFCRALADAVAARAA